jgi:hypothetical protein
MWPAQISQRPVYSYNNTPQLINNENLNDRPILDNRHRKEGERKRFNIARYQYCNRLGHIASECRILAFKKRNRRSEDNRLITINNTDPRFRDKNEAPLSYRNNDGRRQYSSNKTVQNNRNNGPENIRNQGNWQ